VLGGGEQSCLEHENAMAFCGRLGRVTVEQMLRNGRSEGTTSHDNDIEWPRVWTRAARRIGVRTGVCVGTYLRFEQRVAEVSSKHVSAEVGRLAPEWHDASIPRFAAVSGERPRPRVADVYPLVFASKL
jgi:hypothetical protein